MSVLGDHTDATGDGGGASGQPVAFVAVYALAALVAALGVLAAGRLRRENGSTAA